MKNATPQPPWEWRAEHRNGNGSGSNDNVSVIISSTAVVPGTGGSIVYHGNAKSVSSPGNFECLENPMMGSEDFSFMLQCVPGALMLIGNGDSPSLHTAEYDFNDAVLPQELQYFSNLTRIISDS